MVGLPQGEALVGFKGKLKETQCPKNGEEPLLVGVSLAGTTYWLGLIAFLSLLLRE